MLNEIQEFLDYTTPVKYTAESKSDTTYLRHFTLDFFNSFDGLNRVLTILARGYLFQNGVPDIDRAKRALLAWSSIPESKKATPKKEWQYRTDFRELREEFPELVDKNGKGWLFRHAHGMERFILKNTEQIDSRKVPQAEKIRKDFDSKWRTKVEQLQNSIFNSNTKGGWVFRFDDAIAEALEFGPLQNYEITLPEELKQRVVQATSAKTAPYICDLISYYLAHRREDTEWVVLPATSFDNYYCSSYFSKKVLGKIPETILVRQERSGISRYYITDEFLP
ncbi:MAG: hypothetical protein J6J18_08750 [Oscillospiraceae bacterium]|nr:hypothetical protein [Oscillospiraceae bacterium]